MAVESMKCNLSNALHTVSVNGAYNASRALSKWLRRGVRLTCEGFTSVPISRSSTILGEPDEVIAAIQLPLTGDLTGHLLLTFKNEAACLLCDILMQRPEGTTTEIGELEQSCLEETGNIVGSAYANSLAKWLNLHVEPGVPVFAHDMASAVIDPIVMDLAAYHDEVFIALTDFVVDQQRLEWGLLLIPSEPSLRIMERLCQSDGVREKALQTIAVNGAFNASRAMSKWLKRGVRIATDGFTQVPLKDVAGTFDASTPIVALHLPLSRKNHGHALLAISKEHALRLASILTGQTADPPSEIGELEQSCLEETGNIIACSFVNSWSTWLDVHIEPAAPRFVIDYPGAVFDALLADQALVNDEVMIARTEFVVGNEWLEWVFILLPAPSVVRLIEASYA